MKKIVKAALARSGWELGRTADRINSVLADLSEADRAIVSRVDPFTMSTIFGDSEYGRPERIGSVIVPCRNERKYIEGFCAGVMRQQVPAGWVLELVVADGESNDGTRELLRAIAQREPRVRWIDNPGRIVSTGLNAALAVATGEAIVRMRGRALPAVRAR